MSGARFLTDIPAGHRTDWGEAAARALGAALDALDPSGVTASISTTRGGGLRLLLSGATENQRIEIDFWEDDAVVRADGEQQTFRNTSQHRWWQADRGHNWIPELVDYVLKRVEQWSP